MENLVILLAGTVIGATFTTVIRWAARAHKDALDSYFGGGR